MWPTSLNAGGVPIPRSVVRPTGPDLIPAEIDPWAPPGRSLLGIGGDAAPRRRRGEDTGLWDGFCRLCNGSRVDFALALAIVVLLSATILMAVALAKV